MNMAKFNGEHGRDNTSKGLVYHEFLLHWHTKKYAVVEYYKDWWAISIHDVYWCCMSWLGVMVDVYSDGHMKNLPSTIQTYWAYMLRQIGCINKIWWTWVVDQISQMAVILLVLLNVDTIMVGILATWHKETPVKTSTLVYIFLWQS